jgi:hypothetical protein
MKTLVIVSGIAVGLLAALPAAAQQSRQPQLNSQEARDLSSGYRIGDVGAYWEPPAYSRPYARRGEGYYPAHTYWPSYPYSGPQISGWLYWPGHYKWWWQY